MQTFWLGFLCALVGLSILLLGCAIREWFEKRSLERWKKTKFIAEFKYAIKPSEHKEKCTLIFYKRERKEDELNS